MAPKSANERRGKAQRFPEIETVSSELLCFFRTLPASILGLVFRYGSHRCIARWGAVCKSFRAALASEARVRLEALGDFEGAYAGSGGSICKAFSQMMSRQCVGVSYLGDSRSPLRLNFVRWNCEQSGLYLNDLKLIDLCEDTFSRWFCWRSDGGILQYHDRFAKDAVELQSDRDNAIFHASARANADEYAKVADSLRSGDLVPLSPLLEQTLDKILPPSPYVLSRWRCVPKTHSSAHNDLQLDFFNKYFGKARPRSELSDPYPLSSEPPRKRNDLGGELSTEGYYFECLLLAVMPLQPRETLDQIQVAWYKKKFEVSESFEPTVLVLLHWNLPDLQPAHNVAPVGYLLDGHHKLAAAQETGRPISLIVIEARHKRFIDTDKYPPFPWHAPEQEAAQQYLRSEWI